jgi:hypothetical protein
LWRMGVDTLKPQGFFIFKFMAKEVPYFKFFISEWLNGDITLEEMDIQGVFINVCAYYWSKDCELSIINLKKRFRGYENQIDYLINTSIIKLDDQNVIIAFLNDQLNSKEVQKIINRENGSKGGRPKKITEIKPNGFILETETITESKAKANQKITNIKESKEDKKDISVDESTHIDYEKFINYFNSFANRSFRINEKLINTLNKRLKIYSKQQLQDAIKNAHCDDYHITTNFKYLTPELILREDKLERFINNPKSQNNTNHKPSSN